MSPILAVDGLCKRYGALVVTDHLDLSLAAGEALGIIGPNGAGKSTLFGLIAGEIHPDAGRIVFRGQDITGSPPYARCRAGIGRSYQIPRPFSGMTVFENLLVGAAFGAERGGAGPETRCADILERTGLMRKANVRAGSLTLLERKRLELARALATDPALLLLDEIAGGLTEHECRELVALIRDIQAQGVSIIWIEHVLHALRSVISRLMVINFGKVIIDGEPGAVTSNPRVKEIYMGIAAEAAPHA
jgi:branched-chain amino acid transport system ATP-binding protein